MNTEQYANQVRANIRRALKQAVETQATLMRPENVDDPFAASAAIAEIGTVCGYRCIKRNDAMRLGLSGELADSFDTEWFVDFDQKCDIRRGDQLKFGDAPNDLRRVCSVRDGVAKIYRICRLEAI